MTTGAKVAIGFGAAALVGFGIYWFFIRETEKITDGGTKSDPKTAPKPAPGKGGTLDKADKLLRQIKCNKQVPPPRLSKDKIAKYEACMSEANGGWRN